MKYRKKNPPAATSGQGKAKRKRRHFVDLSASAQRARLLAELYKGSVTTLEARKRLDILMPAARVHELRHRYGYGIKTVWTRQETDSGVRHRVARYVLGLARRRHG
jgi:hypothetical protein